MEVASNSYLPGDPRLIDHIVYELKSQGIFDNFRKECIADVDTKPAYLNLRQRVEGSVTTFLRTQRWRPDMNKNHVREMLRRNISESGFLEIGVERIVDQVVNPKINSVFLPQVENVVYKYLGIKKSGQDDKKVETVSKNADGSTANDLLPNDLEAISPEPENISDSKLDLSDEVKKCDDKIDEDESPPFEPIDPTSFSVLEENSVDSHLSGFSGLASHDSNHSIETAKLSTADVINQDSQLSKQSSDDNLTIALEYSNFKTNLTQNSDLSSNNSTELTQTAKDLSSSDKDLLGQNTNESSNQNTKDLLDQKDLSSHNSKDLLSQNTKDLVTHNNKDSSGHHKDSSSQNTRDSSSQRKKSESKDDKKSSDRHRSSDKHRSRNDSKEKDRKSSRDKSKDKSRHHSTRDDDKKYKKDDKERSKSSTSSSSRHSAKKSCDVKSDKKDESKVKSDSKSRHSDRSKSKSYKKDDKHQKSSSSKKDNKSKKDDHYSLKEKKSNRRSTDRDSSDGYSGNHSSSSPFTESSNSQKSNSNQNTFNSGDSGSSEQVDQEKVSESEEKKKILPANRLSEILLKYKEKPKFASNFEEAKKLMKIRKMWKKIEKEREALTKLEEEKKVSEKSTNIYQESIDAEDTYITSAVISKESWDAVEAKVNSENILNIDYNSYSDSTDLEERVDKIAKLITSVPSDDCLYLETHPQSQKYLALINLLTDHIENFVSEKTKLLQNLVHEGDEDLDDLLEQHVIKKNLPKVSIIDISGDKEILISPRKRLHPDVDNNNKTKTQLDDDDKIQESETKLSSSPKPKRFKSSEMAAVHANNFSLPLSPAESDKSLPSDKSLLSDKNSDQKPKRNSITNKASNLRNQQRYSSDDLYKPRMQFTSRRRAAKNLDPDC